MTSPLDQQILRRPVLVPSSRADNYRFARHSGTIAKVTMTFLPGPNFQNLKANLMDEIWKLRECRLWGSF